MDEDYAKYALKMAYVNDAIAAVEMVKIYMTLSDEDAYGDCAEATIEWLKEMKDE